MLSQEWLDVLSLRPQTVLLSFGSVMESVSLPDGVKKAILEVKNTPHFRISVFLTQLRQMVYPHASKLPTFQMTDSFPEVTFIWKYERDDNFTESARKNKNIVFTKWMPQNDLLSESILLSTW